MPKADNLPPSCAVVTKSGNLNFLEPSGPVQACNGTALPLPYTDEKTTCNGEKTSLWKHTFLLTQWLKDRIWLSDLSWGRTRSQFCYKNSILQQCGKQNCSIRIKNADRPFAPQCYRLQYILYVLIKWKFKAKKNKGTSSTSEHTHTHTDSRLRQTCNSRCAKSVAPVIPFSTVLKIRLNEIIT